MNETAGVNTEPKLENFTSSIENNNSSFLPQHLHQPPFSNFSFSPKQGRKHIAAQFQTNNTNLGDVPSISHPLQQQTVQPWQLPEFIKTQPLNENTRDKTLKAELEWKIWKFQRNVKKVVDSMAAGDVGNYLYELKKLIADSKLSQEFQGISEVSIILKLLLEKVMDKVKFGNVAVRVCMIFRGTLHVIIFSLYVYFIKNVLKLILILQLPHVLFFLLLLSEFCSFCFENLLAAVVV